MRFRKQPVEIEAEQFDPQSHPWPHGVKSWPDEHGFQPRDMTWGYVETLEGRMHVMAGDWIITGVEGERYPCKDSIFRKTYMPVNPTPEQIIAMGPFIGPASFDAPVEIQA